MGVPRGLAGDMEDEAKERDLAMLRQLGNAYGQSARAIDREILSLEEKIAHAQEAGEAIPPGWLYQQGRLSSLRDQTERQLDKYGLYADEVITATQTEALEAGTVEAIKLIADGANVPDNINPLDTFAKLPDRAINAQIGKTQDGTPFSEVLGRYSKDVSERMTQTLVEGLALGRGSEKIARDLRDITGQGFYQSFRLARTEVMGSYRSAKLETFRENAEAVEEWEWLTGKDETVCDFCAEMDGQRFPLDEEFDTHPNCRCSPVPVTKSWEELLGTQAPGPEDQEDVDAIPTDDQLKEMADTARQELEEVDRDYRQGIGDINTELDSLVDRMTQAYRDDNMDEYFRLLPTKDALQKERRRLAEGLDGALRGRLSVDKGVRAFVEYSGNKKYGKGVEAFRDLVDDRVLKGSQVNIKGLPGRNRRSFYRDGEGVFMGTDNPQTVVHELGHWLEHGNPDLYDQTQKFHARRTAGEPIQKLRDIYPKSGYDSWETARADQYINAYMGKEYGRQGSSEILSMGLEMFYADPLKLARKDPDYFDFIYSLVRGGMPEK